MFIYTGHSFSLSGLLSQFSAEAKKTATPKPATNSVKSTQQPQSKAAASPTETPPKEQTVASPQEEKVAPPKEQTVASPKEETVAPPKEETVAPPKEETVTSKVEETSTPAASEPAIEQAADSTTTGEITASEGDIESMEEMTFTVIDSVGEEDEKTESTA